MTARDDGFRIDFAGGRKLNLDMVRQRLRQRRSAFMPDGGHAWVVSTTYAIDDPGMAMDMMELDDTNFIGVSNIYCLLCNEAYAENGVNRSYKCSQTLPEER